MRVSRENRRAKEFGDDRVLPYGAVLLEGWIYESYLSVQCVVYT